METLRLQHRLTMQGLRQQLDQEHSQAVHRMQAQHDLQETAHKQRTVELQTQHSNAMLEKHRAQLKTFEEMQSSHKAAMQAVRQELEDAEQCCKNLRLEAETRRRTHNQNLESVKLQQRLQEAKLLSANHARTQAFNKDLEKCKSEVLHLKRHAEQVRCMWLKTWEICLIIWHGLFASAGC